MSKAFPIEFTQVFMSVNKNRTCTLIDLWFFCYGRVICTIYHSLLIKAEDWVNGRWWKKAIHVNRLIWSVYLILIWLCSVFSILDTLTIVLDFLGVLTHVRTTDEHIPIGGIVDAIFLVVDGCVTAEAHCERSRSPEP